MLIGHQVSTDHTSIANIAANTLLWRSSPATAARSYLPLFFVSTPPEFGLRRSQAPTIGPARSLTRLLLASPSSAARARALSTHRRLSLSLRLRCQLAVHLAGEKTRSNQLCISRSQTKSDTLYLIATFNAQISLLNKLLFSNCEYPLMQGCPVTFDQK